MVGTRSSLFSCREFRHLEMARGPRICPACVSGTGQYCSEYPSRCLQFLGIVGKRPFFWTDVEPICVRRFHRPGAFSVISQVTSVAKTACTKQKTVVPLWLRDRIRFGDGLNQIDSVPRRVGPTRAGCPSARGSLAFRPLASLGGRES